MSVTDKIGEAITRSAFKIATKFFRYKGRRFHYKQIKTRYPSMRFLFTELLNSIFACFGNERSFRPIIVGVEPLNICNLTCLECEVNRTMKRSKGVMDLGLFKKMIDENQHVFRINITNYGEPLLHKDILEMISYASSKKKVCLMVTNGTLLTDEISRRLINSGLKLICFSVDGVGEVYKKVRGWDYKDLEKKILIFLELNKESGSPVTTEINMVEFGSTEGEWSKVQSAWADKVDVMMKSPLIQEKFLRKRRCMHLWRGMVVLNDGTVTPCCIDMEARMNLGNVKENSLLDIFNGKAMRELRRRHLRSEFPEVCVNCNEYFG